MCRIIVVLFVFTFFTVEGFKISENLKQCWPTANMIDASGKIPNGVMSGNVVDLGNFDQCVKSDAAKYCLLKISLPISKISFHTFRSTHFNLQGPEMHKIKKRAVLMGSDNSTGLILGWCLPRNCSIIELSNYFTNYLKIVDKELGIQPFLGGMCQNEDDLKNEYTAGNIIIITFFGITLFIMTISTLYDIYIQSQKKRPAHILLIAFSIKTNGQKLLNVSKNSDQLSCLHGIRLISMMWIVYGHRVSSVIMSPIDNILTTKDWINNGINMYVLNAPVAVDTFFVLSGLLLSYGYCLAKDKGVRFNIFLFYLHRYLRLTPVLAVVVWTHATILNFFGSGPFWPLMMSTLQDFCIDKWWSPLVYIQNYYNNEEMCLGQTWYLAVDMQLFIVSPIILIPLWKWPKQTSAASFILILGSMAISFAISYIKNLPGFSVNATGDQNYLIDYYYPAHTRYGPWLIGLILGYYIFKLKKNKNNRIPLHPAQVAFGWIVSIGIMLTVLFAGHKLVLEYDKLGNAFFNGLHRHAWALGLSWVIFACVNNYGGPINAFLSWSAFQVLGRLTYTIYLVHLSVQYLMVGASKTISHFSDFQSMYMFWGDFSISLVFAICLTLAYESPMVTIEKVLFKKGNRPRNPEQRPTTVAEGQTNDGFVKD